MNTDMSYVISTLPLDSEFIGPMIFIKLLSSYEMLVWEASKYLLHYKFDSMNALITVQKMLQKRRNIEERI